MSSTQAVLDRHLQCFAACDVDGTLADFADDAVLLTDAYGALRGHDAIRAFFSAAFAEFKQPGTSFSMKAMLVEGDCAFIAWNAETSANVFEFATDTFVVRNGRIAVQTYGCKVTPKA